MERKLLITFDIGTTFSGVSYCIIDEPARVPEIKAVTRFSGQDHVGGNCKVPSIVLYSRADGRFLAAGAKAIEMEDCSIGGQPWYKVEWFKLHLRPNPRLSPYITQQLPPLPPNKAVVDVFADYLRYLYNATLEFITETHHNGSTLVSDSENNHEKVFVITHPNGWEGVQQYQLRKAAVMAGLISGSEEDRSRIHFVTEGEAGLHFCIQQQRSAIKSLKNGEGILVVDAGGGTIDMSAYGQKKRAEENLFHEICIFKGSVFVSRNMKAYLDDQLSSSSFSQDAEYIASCFDKTDKLRFSNKEEPLYVKFGRPSDRNEMLGILAGAIKIPGHIVASFFQPSVAAIADTALMQMRNATKNISTVFLVGGFSASNYMYRTLKTCLGEVGLKVIRPDSHLNKAVADGAALFYINRSVKARFSKHTYGIPTYVPYDSTNIEHRTRLGSVFTDSDGVDNVQYVFCAILHKGTEVLELTEFRQKFFRKESNINAFENPMKDTILCYRGPNDDPQWTDVEKDMYSTLCTVVSDITRAKKSLRPKRGKFGQPYYCLNYEVILRFGLTELEAQTCWRENGKEVRSAAQILYDIGSDN